MRSEKDKVYDSYLAASARLGDRQALANLVDRWQQRLLAHARRLTGEPELAADVTQEAWIEIIRGIARLNDSDAFAAWAFRIVTRRCARAIGRRQRRRKGQAALVRATDPTASAGPTDERHADLATVRDAMAKLPPDQHAALALFYLEDLRIAEIAVALDTAPGTIKTRLMHARNKLRAKLQGETP
jgi:RNA polymerase sigma-70 factor (ECF subfamily)